MDETQERLYKAALEPAAWVMPGQRAMAQQCYNRYLEEIRNTPKNPRNYPDIVPYEVRLRGIEKLVTDPAFRKFWEKAGEYYVINTISGLYSSYTGSMETGLHPDMPYITFTEREKKLSEAAEHLNKYVQIMQSDSSLRTIFQCAFGEAFNDAGLQPKLGPNNEGPYHPWQFFATMYSEISEPSSRSRAMKTHTAYPDKPSDRRLNQRGRFMYYIQEMIQYTMRKPSYTLTAKILDVIRPDIGPFTADQIRKYVERRKKPEPVK